MAIFKKFFVYFYLNTAIGKIEKYTNFNMTIIHCKNNSGAAKLREVIIYQKAHDNQLLSRKEIAFIFRCNIEAVSAWVQQGIPVELKGNALKVTRGIKPRFLFYDVLNWLENRSFESARQNHSLN